MSDTAELEDELHEWQLQLEESTRTLEYLTGDEYEPDVDTDSDYRETDIGEAEADIAEALHHIERISAKLSRLSQPPISNLQ
jgi:hypothetical protein